jgi:hypothetical protein
MPLRMISEAAFIVGSDSGMARNRTEPRAVHSGGF